MTEAVNGPANGPVQVPVVNPWAYCSGCGGDVDARAAGRNLPCGCVAEVASACATWEPWYGCRCSHVTPDEADAAAALQEALEDQERSAFADGLMQQLLDDAVEQIRRPQGLEDSAAVVPVRLVLPDELDADELERRRAQAVERLARGLDLPPSVIGLTRRPEPGDEVLQQGRRLRAALSWVALIVALLAIMALWSAGGPW